MIIENIELDLEKQKEIIMRDFPSFYNSNKERIENNNIGFIYDGFHNKNVMFIDFDTKEIVVHKVQ